MANQDYKKGVIVLRKTLEQQKAEKMIEEKKSRIFRSFLKKPASEEVHTHSINLNYEPVLMISGSYKADFYRKAIHPIKVDYNVTEVVLGEGVFPIKTKSVWKKALSGKKAKNNVDLELEEHVLIDAEKTMFFDQHGKEIDFPYKLDAENRENYPTKILQNEKFVIKKPEMTHKEAIEKLREELRGPTEPNIRDLKEELTINEISEIYVPIYEARLVGPKKKVEILRIDAVRNKIL